MQVFVVHPDDRHQPLLEMSWLLSVHHRHVQGADEGRVELLTVSMAGNVISLPQYLDGFWKHGFWRLDCEVTQLQFLAALPFCVLGAQLLH